MGEGRHGGFGLCCLGEWVYVVGGYGKIVVVGCERYSVVKDEWGGLPCLPEHSSVDLSLCSLKQRYIYVFGMYDNTQSNIFPRLDTQKLHKGWSSFILKNPIELTG